MTTSAVQKFGVQVCPVLWGVINNLTGREGVPLFARHYGHVINYVLTKSGTSN